MTNCSCVYTGTIHELSFLSFLNLSHFPIVIWRGSVILEKFVQFQNQKSWKMNLLGLKMKHVILKIRNILTSDTKFYPHHFNIIRVTGC